MSCIEKMKNAQFISQLYSKKNNNAGLCSNKGYSNNNIADNDKKTLKGELDLNPSHPSQNI